MESFGLALALVVLASVSPDPTKEADEYPYVVSIHRNITRRNFICAGSLIAPTWVLTSSNCLTKVAYKIRYGDMMTMDNSTYSLILNRIHHISSKSLHLGVEPNRLTPKTNNIALAFIEKIPTWQLGVLSANDYFSILGYEVTYFEFGFLPVVKTRKFKNMKQIFAFHRRYAHRAQNLSYKDSSNQIVLDKPNPIDTKVLRMGTGVVITCPVRDHPGPNICVAKKCFDFDDTDPRHSLMAPDPGAPLIYDKRVIGVTSNVERHYLRFTPVSPYLDWIHEQIKEEVLYKLVQN